MGGAAGHIQHPYDKYKDPQDFLNFFKKFISGEIEGTEKVDGYNLFISFNKNGNVVAVRNKNQDPIQNIIEKFPLTHGAYAGFNAGWKAIKSKLENLSEADRKKYNLIDNFLNIEILFGYIPNVVPYSMTTNYIVFHDYVGNPDNNWQPQNVENEKALLKKLANKLNSVAINSSEIIFAGNPGKIKQTRKDIKSYWEFKGPINITKKDIKNQLSKIAKEWQSYPEVNQLKKTDDSEKQLELMKTITKKIGSETLSTIVSKLSKTGKKVDGYLGIEGIVIKQGGDKIKITGSFLDYSNPDDVRIFDATRNLREYIQKEVFGLTTLTLRNLKDKSFKGLNNYIITKRKKKYTYDINELLDDSVKDNISRHIKKAQQDIKNTLPDLRKKAREYDIRNMLSQSFMLSKLKEAVEKSTILEEVLHAYAKIFYNIKKRS